MTKLVLSHRAIESGTDTVRLTLNNPERSNSLTAEMLGALCDQLAMLADNPPDILVLAGEGSHLSTGGDVRRFAEEVAAGHGQAYAVATVGKLHAAVLALVDLPSIVMTRAMGATTGGSIGLVLAADLVAMQRRAFFQPWYSVVGFSPDGGWTGLLPDLIGPGAAMAALSLNQRIDAPRAQTLDLVTGVDEDVDTLISGWIATLGGHRGASLRASKRLIWDAPRRALFAQRLEAEQAAFLELIDQPETIAGMQAFLEGQT